MNATASSIGGGRSAACAARCGAASPPAPRPSCARSERSLAAARRAGASRDEVGLAAARGRILAALRRGALAVAVAAARRGDAAEARAWLQIRDFRQTTRFTRPGRRRDRGGGGARRPARGSPRETAVQIEKDLLDAFQARLFTNLDEAAQAAERGFGGRFAETAAIVHGYWLAIAAEYGEQRGAGRAAGHRPRLRRASPRPAPPSTGRASKPPASGSKPTSRASPRRR